MTAVFIGLLFIAFGSWGLMHWLQECIFLLKGIVPISVFLGGVIALIVGLSALRNNRIDEKQEK